ncbi:MAG: AAA-type ATPase lid domain-containing protein, partial [Rhodobacterales bacterium]
TKFMDFFDAIEPVKITIPSLRARRKDLPILFEQILRQLVRNLDLDMPNVPQSIYAQIMSKDWNSNIPELRNFARNFLLDIGLSIPKEEEKTLADQLYSFEALVLCETLRRTKGKATLASMELGLPRKTFYDRLARYNIKPKDFR